MARGSIVDAVLRCVSNSLGAATGETEHVRRWDAPGMIPVNVERRGVRWVNVWVPWNASLCASTPHSAKYYAKADRRNTNLSKSLQNGHEVLAIKVTWENLSNFANLMEKFPSVNRNAIT